jgi:uncharacterized protein (TIGR00369 family)
VPRGGTQIVTGREPTERVLAEGHAFDAFDWREVAVKGADLAIEMAVTPYVVNSSGALQGGLMATLADMVAGSALVKGEGAYQSAFTSELHISYLAGARVGPVRATAHVLRRGKRTAVVRVEMLDVGADDLPVATSTVTFSVRRAAATGDAAAPG